MPKWLLLISFWSASFLLLLLVVTVVYFDRRHRPRSQDPRGFDVVRRGGRADETVK